MSSENQLSNTTINTDSASGNSQVVDAILIPHNLADNLKRTNFTHWSIAASGTVKTI